MCEQIFKKPAHQHSSNSFNCEKSQEHRNIAQLSLQPHSYNIKITATSFVCDQLKRKHLRAQAILERPRDEF